MSRGNKLWRVLDLDTKVEIVFALTNEGCTISEIVDIVGISKYRVKVLRTMGNKLFIEGKLK